MNNSDQPIKNDISVPQALAADSVAEIPRTPAYSAVDRVFAWLSYLFGYLFCRTFPLGENPLGGFLFVLVAFAVTFWVLRLKKVKMASTFLGAGISAVVFSAALILTESPFLRALAYLYAVLTYCYFLYAAFGNAMEPGFSDFVFIDYFKAIFLLPCPSLLKVFSAIAYGKAKNGMKNLLKIAAGAAIAIVPTVVVLLLLSFDDGFLKILGRIFSLDFSDIFSHIWSLLLAIPVSMYVFGLYVSSSKRLMRDTVTAEGCRKGFAAIRFVPRLTALTAVLPILFLYVVYFISQWQYYISGFTGVLPARFSYAEYARHGFFQLCAVSVINLIIIVTIMLFMKRGGKRSCPALKALTVIFCVFTLVLISTAVAKLVMYIDCYGLTQKRIYAMWLMTVIAIVYMIIAVGQFVPRIKTVAASVSACVVLFGTLCLCNVNERVAQYNVDRYMAGTLETVDMEAVERLGDSAVPSLVHLAQKIESGEVSSSGQLYGELTGILQRRAGEIEAADTSIFSFTIPAYKAEAALTAYGLLE